MFRDEVLCDIKLETNDGANVYGHKVVLASVSPYFRAMFSSFEVSNKDYVKIREINFIALDLLMEFIYMVQIMATEKKCTSKTKYFFLSLTDYLLSYLSTFVNWSCFNVLFRAPSLLQLHDVQDVCCDFLQSQLNPTNYLHINTLADLYSCRYTIIVKFQIINSTALFV